MQKELTLHEAAMFAQALSTMPPARLRESVVYKMADNLIAINNATPDLNAATAKMFEESGCPQENDPGFKDYLEKKIQFERETKLSVDFKMIRYEELNIGVGDNSNHFPPHFVVAMRPMLLEEAQ